MSSMAYSDCAGFFPPAGSGSSGSVLDVTDFDREFIGLFDMALWEADQEGRTPWDLTASGTQNDASPDASLSPCTSSAAAEDVFDASSDRNLSDDAVLLDHVRPAITSMGAPGPLFVTFSDVTDLPPAPPIPSFASFEVFLDAFDEMYGSGSVTPADAAYWDGQDPPVGTQAPQHLPSTSGAHPWDEGLERPDVSMVAVQERPCTRKHRIPDEEIWSKLPKKSKCAASTRLPYTSPLHRPLSPPPSSTASPAARPTVPPEPIVVVPHEGLQCRMPSCDASLSITDSAWRGHFLNRHHDEICAAGRACPDPRRCLCICPFKDCAGRVRGGVVQPMSLDSLGRHVLNVHVGVRHQCPVCGAEKKQRRSACVRHIAVCWAKAVGGH